VYSLPSIVNGELRQRLPLERPPLHFACPVVKILNVRFRELVDSRKNIDGQKEKHL
jgi:hypothetical protein